MNCGDNPKNTILAAFQPKPQGFIHLYPASYVRAIQARTERQMGAVGTFANIIARVEDFNSVVPHLIRNS